jgi:methionine transaminase
MPHSPINIQSKLPKVGVTVFTQMSKLAEEHNAINLSQGFPNFNCSEELLSLVEKHLKKGHNQYAPMPGLMHLREAIAAKTEELYGAKYNPETEITITSGATQAIYTAISAIIKQDDEVIIFTPAYDCYAPAVTLSGGRAVYVELKAPSYEPDWNTVKKMINHRTRMIIINTPHNPTGSIFKEKDMQKLQKLVKGTDIIILSDEVYEHIIFDKESHLSVCRYPDLAERSFVVSSFGKTYHTTGWKIGYILAPEILSAEFRKCHQYIVFSANTPIQHALSEYLQKKDAYLELNNFYQKKRDYFLSLIAGSKFKFKAAPGTYFQLLDYSGLTDKKDTDYAIELTKKHKIASVPVSVFYNTAVDNKVLRFCFAKNDETIEKAAEILCKI